MDGPCKLLVRKSTDKLLAEHFFKLEIPGPNRTANIIVGKFQGPTILYTALLLLVLFINVSHVTHPFEMRKQNIGKCFRVTWSIYMYNLSMNASQAE